MLLNQVPQSGESTSEEIRQLALADFMASFPLANYTQFYTMIGNADSQRKADSIMTAGSNRSISEGYTPKDNTPTFAPVLLKIYGDRVKTDIAYERRGIDIGSQRQRDLSNFARSLGRYFMDSIINDALGTKTFSGLKEQVETLGLKTVFDTVNGGSLPTGNGNTERKQQDKFIELVTDKISKVSPTVIVGNSAFFARLTSVGRAYVTTNNVKDIYGMDRVITSFYGVPLVDAGFAANGSGLIVPVNETEGTSTSMCTSLYMVRFGEQMDVTLATNKGMDVKDLGLVDENYETLMEMDVDLVVLDNTALHQISGIIL